MKCKHSFDLLQEQWRVLRSLERNFPDNAKDDSIRQQIRNDVQQIYCTYVCEGRCYNGTKE